MELIKLELRKAVPEDLKQNQQQLKIGFPYAIVSPDGTAEGVFSLTGKEDPFVLKGYLDREMIYVPVIDYRLEEFLKTKSEDCDEED